MRKSSWNLRMWISMSLIISIILGLSSCGLESENHAHRVMSEKQICSGITYMQKKIQDTLSESYQKKSTDSFNIDLSKNHIEDRTSTSWYVEEYVNESGILITVDYSVEYSSLWFRIEMSGKNEDYSAEEYEKLVSFYEEFTEGNIKKNKIFNLIEKKNFKVGEFSFDYKLEDVFIYKVTKKGRFCFSLAGIADNIHVTDSEAES